MQLIVVESPTKAKTISRFLPSEYVVESSYGHVRDLPASELGVDVEHNFEPKYVTPLKARARIVQLKKYAAKADEIILATDEDREGEAIAWHLAQVLGLEKSEILNPKSQTNPKSKIQNSKPQRIVFHEITKSAILHALETPREIDMNLVNSQQARRVLDRLVGYKLSPFLWKKIFKGLSAGRVQSVAVRLVVDREREREKFKAQEYWSVEAKLQPTTTDKQQLTTDNFVANLYAKDGKALDKFAVTTQEDADKILEELKNASWNVEKIERKETKRNPLPPFTTSTLQQAAWQRLHFNAKYTMQIAQGLYEKGLCMDGDSLVVSSTGEIHKIKELQNKPNVHIIATEEGTLKQKYAAVKKFWTLPSPRHVITLQTDSNDEVTATADHRFLIMRNGNPAWVEAENIQQDDYIAAPEYISVERQQMPSSIFEIIETLPPETQAKIRFKFTPQFPHLAYSNTRQENELNYHTIKNLLAKKITTIKEIEKFCEGIYVKPNTGRATPQKISLYLTPETVYVLGFITGDGHLDTRINFCIKSSSVNLSRLRVIIERVIKQPFPGLTPLKVQYRLQSTILYHLFQQLGCPKGNKSSKIDIPNILLRQPDKILQSYIAGLWDADGCITKSWKKSIRISYSSKSKLFIEKLQILLKTFGINSAKHYDKRTGVHWLLLTSQGIVNFHKYIAPYLVIKKDTWTKLYSAHAPLYEGRVISRCQGVPMINTAVEELLMHNKIRKQKIAQLVGVDMFNYFGGVKIGHTRNPFFPKKILGKISAIVDTDDALLKNLSESPLIWKRIKKTHKSPYNKKYVYDVTTTTNTFIVNGLVSHNCTYHRTDSLNLAQSAQEQARDFITKEYGSAYWPGAPRSFRTKAKGAQEAHEAIRPTEAARTEKDLDDVEPAHKKLYNLIRRRFLASQMSAAIFDAATVDIATQTPYSFRANGSVKKFEGFLRLYPLSVSETELPELAENEELALEKLEPFQHFTQPPARYNEATLVKALEQHGIGRPSTYAPILSTIQERNYIEKDEQKRFVPTKTGIMVNDLLVEHFPQVVDLQFTARVEEDLDIVAQGEKEWTGIMHEFYDPFAKLLAEKYESVEKLTPVEKTDRTCPECGKPLLIRTGRFGRFYACSGFPKCRHTEPLAKQESSFPAVSCPKCLEGTVTEKHTKTRKIFYGCARYPACDFALWYKPALEEVEGKLSVRMCPQCQSALVDKPRGIMCSSKECKYKEKKFSDDTTDAEKTPE